MLNKLQNSFLGIPKKVFRILVCCFISSTFWMGANTSATPLVLTTVKGDQFSANLEGFDEKTRKIQLESEGKTYAFSLSDLQYSSKIAVLRSNEMQEVLSNRGKPTLLYGFLAATLIGVLLVIGFPTFLGAAFLITGQEGKKHHFKAWLKVVALIGLIAGIRLAAPDGILWTNVAANGFHIFQAENGLALVVALAGAIWLIKHHYRETVKLATLTLGVHFVFFVLFFALASVGVTCLIWKWYGGDLTIPADGLLTRLILQPLELI